METNQIARSPTALLKCTEIIDMFNEIEDTTTDYKQDVSQEGCIESFIKVESVSDDVTSQCSDKKEPQAPENLERLASTEHMQSMSLEKGTQTQMTKQRETEAQTIEQGTQTEGNMFCSTSGCDVETTETENDKWSESTQQEQASSRQHNCLECTGNEEAPFRDVCSCGNHDVVSRNSERFAAKRLRGSSKKEVKETHKCSFQISSSPHPVSDNQKTSAVLDNDDLLSNQRNINWYLSLLINVLTCDVHC